MDCSTPDLPVLHYLLEFAQTRVHWLSDAIPLSYPLLPPSPLALNLSQHQGLFQWVSSLGVRASVYELEEGTIQSITPVTWISEQWRISNQPGLSDIQEALVCVAFSTNRSRWGGKNWSKRFLGKKLCLSWNWYCLWLLCSTTPWLPPF